MSLEEGSSHVFLHYFLLHNCSILEPGTGQHKLHLTTLKAPGNKFKDPHSLTSSFGGGNSIFLSIRPGRKRAESKMSMRFVAMTTLMFLVASNPSSWFSNSNMVLCTSLSPVSQTNIHFNVNISNRKFVWKIVTKLLKGLQSSYG